MNNQFQQNPAYPGFPQGTQPPPGLSMMDPNIAQMAQQRYMQQHQQQLAAMHAAGMAGFSNIPGAPGGPQQQQQQQPGMRMPPGMPGMGGMPGMPGPGGPSSHPGQVQHAMHPTPPAPKQKRKPGPQPRNNPASQMMPQARPPPTTAEQYMKNAMAPPANHLEAEPWADSLDELDARELAMGRFRARQEMLEEVFGPEPLKSIPQYNGDAWAGLGMDGETLEAKVAALEKENEELEKGMDRDIDAWKKRIQDFDSGELGQSPVAAT